MTDKKPADSIHKMKASMHFPVSSGLKNTNMVRDKLIKAKQAVFFTDKPQQHFRSVSPVYAFADKLKKTETPSSGARPETRASQIQTLRGALENKMKIISTPNAVKSVKESASFLSPSKRLLEAVKRNDFEEALNLVSKENEEIDVNITGENDWTALHFACWTGNIKMVNLLFYNRADLNAVARNGVTPPMVCCSKGNHKLLLHLITLKADLHTTDANGNTLLHYAAKSGSVECVKILISKKITDIYEKNVDGKAAIDVCKTIEMRMIFENSAKLLELELAEKCIKISSVDSENFCMTPGQMNTKRLKTESTDLSHSNSDLGPKDFAVHALIGKGSFGEVYLVERLTDGLLFAMKVLQKSTLIQHNLMKYAVAERNVLTLTKDHPFIVSLHYAFQSKDKLFLVLDYCPGGDMAKLLKEKQRLTEDVARIYLAEIVLSLERLHSQNIIYRDLKPANIVFDAQGHAMLTDFGLSKEGVTDSDRGAESFCGSVSYLAPEMLGRSGHGKAVDWYLLGVLFFEMLVGVPPQGNNWESKLPKTCSEHARSLLHGLLEISPQHRLGSTDQDAEELKAHPFFNNINWRQVLDRKLVPPKPTIKKLLPFNKAATFLAEENPLSAHDTQQIENWSFIMGQI